MLWTFASVLTQTHAFFDLNEKTCKLAVDVINKVQMDCHDKSLLYADKLSKMEADVTAADITAAIDKDCRCV